MAYTIFGVASAVGGVLALLLPETLGSPLPDTFQDVEVTAHSKNLNSKLNGKQMLSLLFCYFSMP